MDHSWHNKVAEQRADCRRYAGIPGDYQPPEIEERPLVDGAAMQGKFKIIRSGMPYTAPSWTMPKDAQQSMLA